MGKAAKVPGTVQVGYECICGQVHKCDMQQYVRDAIQLCPCVLVYAYKSVLVWLGGVNGGMVLCT